MKYVWKNDDEEYNIKEIGHLVCGRFYTIEGRNTIVINDLLQKAGIAYVVPQLGMVSIKQENMAQAMESLKHEMPEAMYQEVSASWASRDKTSKEQGDGWDMEGMHAR